MQQVVDTFGATRKHHGIITVSDIWPCYVEETAEIFNVTTDLRTIVMPTRSYLQHMREKYDDWEDKVIASAKLFVAACVRDTHTEELHMRDYIRLSEDFVLLTALPEKWSLYVRHKCTCPLFFRKGMCEHVVLLAMIADPTRVLLPNKSDLSQIRSRAGKKRGRPAAQADSDSTEEKRRKPKERRAEKEPELRDGILPDSDDDDQVGTRLPYTYVGITSNQSADSPVHARRESKRRSQSRSRRCSRRSRRCSRSQGELEG